MVNAELIYSLKFWALAGKNTGEFFFKPIVFETAEIQNDNPFIQDILATGRELVL